MSSAAKWIYLDITEDDVQYPIESDIPQQENAYDCGIYIYIYVCVNMPKKLRGMLQVPYKKRTVQKYGKE